MVRSIAAALSRPVRDRPSPSLTMREKESMTRNPPPSPAAGARDQQPAIIGAEIERGVNAVLDQARRRAAGPVRAARRV